MDQAYLIERPLPFVLLYLIVGLVFIMVDAGTGGLMDTSSSDIESERRRLREWEQRLQKWEMQLRLTSADGARHAAGSELDGPLGCLLKQEDGN